MRLTLAVALAAGLGAGACSGLRLAGGLDADSIVSISAAPEVQGGLCPGFDSRLVITARLDDGRTVSTAATSRPRISWESFDADMTGGTIDVEGRVRVLPDPRVTFGRAVTYRVNAFHDPRLQVAGQIPVRYDCAFVAHFDGRPGRRGDAGAAGRAGAAGDTIEVTVKAARLPAGGAPLLEVSATSRKRRRSGLVIFDPARGSLTIRVRGGAGGAGGAGVDGAPGGVGGPGGPGGTVRVVVDPSARALYDQIRYDLGGGAGGAGPDGETGPAGADGPAPVVVFERVLY